MEKTKTILHELSDAYIPLAAKRWGEAETIYRRVLEREPENADALRFLATILGTTGRYHQAVPVAKAAAEHPDNEHLASVWFDYGLAQIHSDNRESVLAGMAATNKGVARNAQAWPAYWNLSLGHLLLGEWEAGWKFFEMGYMSGTRQVRTRDSETVWKGEELGPDKTLFIHWEQGLGDTLMWLRLLPRVKELSGGARIVLEVQRPLYMLLKYSTGVMECVDELRKFNPEDPLKLPAFDAWTSLMSLPFRCGLKSPEDARCLPYLNPICENYFERLRYDPAEFRVGLVWAGNPDHSNDMNRSLHLADLEPLGSVEEANFYALQVGARADEAETPPDIFDGRFTNMGPACERLGFRHTASLLRGLDVLVTCDTSLAHLAGAMGIQTYLMLPWAPDYRWGLYSSFTPLYPSVELFRQPKPGDWKTVVRKIAARLHKEAEFKIGEAA